MSEIFIIAPETRTPSNPSFPFEHHLAICIVRVWFRLTVLFGAEDQHTVSLLFDLGIVFTIVDREAEAMTLTNDNVKVFIGIAFGQFFS